MKKPVFVETLRIENGIIYNLDIHQERMYKTAFFHYGTKPELKIDMAEIPSHLQKERIKCRVLYADNVIATEYHAYQIKKICSLQIVEDNNIEYNHKFVDRNALNNLFEQRNGTDDIIIVKNGNITDTSFANLVFESLEGELFTPKTYLLEGTKRKLLLKTGIIKEKTITVDDMALYKKIYLINAMVDIGDGVSVGVTSVGL
ncbi:MAG: aminotransferase class IV [Bacteroidetes bacterium]|nr:aminotransferase class IV [Bacteroidota bacterium]MCL2302228.1 aminotransferase class IV [Lentimicrobiaceae bacterium]MCL2302308.1 aminotransferase class IV [Lentimicrobiaceae bacterium]